MIEFKPTDKYADIFTERYECDDYACMAHPNGCFFCEHLTDVFWDFTHGPYMFFCEQGEEGGKTGLNTNCANLTNYGKRNYSLFWHYM